jgi:hypothetical protein
MSGHGPSKPSHSRSSEALIVSDLRTLQEDVKKLKEDSNSAWKKSAAGLGILGGILGIVSALITLPRSIHEAKDTIAPRPQTTVEYRDLGVNYDRTEATFRLDIPFYIRNEGSATDLIHTARATLRHSPALNPQKMEGDDIQIFNAASNEFSFYEKGTLRSSPSERISLPLAIESKKGRNAFCSIRFDQGTFAGAGTNILEVTLSSDQDRTEKMSFIFYLNQQQIDELKSADKTMGKYFIDSNYGGS